jgi:hypothetical protein
MPADKSGGLGVEERRDGVDPTAGSPMLKRQRIGE